MAFSGRRKCNKDAELKRLDAIFKNLEARMKAVNPVYVTQQAPCRQRAPKDMTLKQKNVFRQKALESYHTTAKVWYKDRIAKLAKKLNMESPLEIKPKKPVVLVQTIQYPGQPEVEYHFTEDDLEEMEQWTICRY